jgi:predicted outer membrane repeat protein
MNCTISNNVTNAGDSYGDGGGIYSTGTFIIKNSTIKGNSAIEGGGIYSTGTLTITNNTITVNSAQYGGGGIYSSGDYAILTVTDSTITENSGGGISSSGNITIINSVVSKNRTDSGYGNGIICSGNATITDCTISENTGSYGGGININDSGTVIITDSIISGNNARYGGGITNSGTLTITNSTIGGNSAGRGSSYGNGGGILTTGILTITNSTISGNSSAQSGGGIEIYSSSTLTVINSTITQNSNQYGRGAGIYNEYSTVTLYNTIVANNDISGSAVSGYNNLTSYTGWASPSGNNIVYDPAKPLFVDAANGDYRLAPNSQAIDKGDNTYVSRIAEDLAGNIRINNGTVDIGAYEYHAAPVIFTYSNLTKDSVTLNWSDVDGAVKYKILLVGIGQVYELNSPITSYSLSSLTSDKVYHCVLSVDYGDGKHVAAKSLRFQTLPANLAPAIPEGFKVVNGTITKNSVTLSWKNDPTVYYNLRYRVNGTTDWEYNIYIPTGGEYNVTSLIAGLKYDFQLIASNSNGTAATELIGKVETQNDGTDYAVLFSGGVDIKSNHPIYYNALKEAYSILKDQYGLLPENIYVLYADGNDTGNDTYTKLYYDKNNNPYVKDEDKINSDMSFIKENLYKATSKNFSTVLDTISSKMTNENDHLLVWTSDHGGDSDWEKDQDNKNLDKTGNEYISGWGEDWGLGWGYYGLIENKITDNDFATNMKKIQNGYVTMVLGQCFSGGILDNIFDPATEKTLKGFSTNVHWFGMATANHDETSVTYLMTDSSAVGFESAFFNVIKNNPSIKTGNVLFEEVLKLFPKGTVDVAGWSYVANGADGIHIGDKNDRWQHPWQVGESFSIFTSAAQTTAKISSDLSVNSICTAINSSSHEYFCGWNLEYGYSLRTLFVSCRRN